MFSMSCWFNILIALMLMLNPVFSNAGRILGDIQDSNSSGDDKDQNLQKGIHSKLCCFNNKTVEIAESSCVRPHVRYNYFELTSLLPSASKFTSKCDKVVNIINLIRTETDSSGASTQQRYNDEILMDDNTSCKSERSYLVAWCPHKHSIVALSKIGDQQVSTFVSLVNTMPYGYIQNTVAVDCVKINKQGELELNGNHHMPKDSFSENSLIVQCDEGVLYIKDLLLERHDIELDHDLKAPGTGGEDGMPGMEGTSDVPVLGGTEGMPGMEGMSDMPGVVGESDLLGTGGNQLEPTISCSNNCGQVLRWKKKKCSCKNNCDIEGNCCKDKGQYCTLEIK